MFRYGNIHDYVLERPHRTKLYQRAFMSEWLPKYVTRASSVIEVGADANVGVLGLLDVAERWIADPYEGDAGGKQRGVPDLGEAFKIARCTIGLDSDSLPSESFDLLFSISVIEHIGQKEAGYDCSYTPDPPEAQEAPRKAFCAECFRLLKPGGVTIHTIDHGVRNVTFDTNFRNAGFEPLLDDPRIDAMEMLNDPEAFRQDSQWGNPENPTPMPEEIYPLNTVLMLGYRKPDGKLKP